MEITFGHLQTIQLYMKKFLIILQRGLTILSAIKSYEQELTEDLISILHYFSIKSYSHRRKINKMRKELEQEERNKKQEDN